MAQEGVIRNFMVALGFKTDNSGLGQMQNAMKGVELKAVALKGALMALATGAVIAVRQTASELDKLYFSSQRIGASATNITAFGNAISQMGGNAETALGTLESLAEKMRNSPGYEGMINSLGVNTKQANGEMRDRVEVMKDLSGVLAQMPAYQANAYASSLGIDQNTLLAMRDGKFLSNMEKYQKIQEQLGMNDDLTKSGNEFMTEYRDLTMMTKTGFQVIVMQAGKALIPILRLLNQLIQSGISAFSQLNPEIKNMLGIALRFAMATLVFGGFIKTFGLLLKFIPMIKGLIGLVRLLNLSLLASPIGFVIALAAALALLYDDYQTWKEGGKSLFDWSKWTSGLNVALDFIQRVGQYFVDLKNKIISVFSEIDPSIQDFIKNALKVVAIGFAFSKLSQIFKMLGGVKSIFSVLGKSLGFAKGGIIGLSKGAFRLIRALLSLSFGVKKLMPVLRLLLNVFKFTPIGRAIALIGLLASAIQWLIKDFNKWKSGADSFLPWGKWSKSIDRIMDKIRNFLDLLSNVKDKVINFVQKIISDPVEAVKEVVDTAKDALQIKDGGEPNQPVKTINEVSKNIVDGANNLVGKALDVGTTTIKGLIGASKETLGLGDDQSKADATKLADGIKSMTQKGVEAVVNVGKSVDQVVKDSFKFEQKYTFSFGKDVDKYIKEASEKYQIDEKVLRGFVKMEAGWTGKMSPTGAIGTGQFIQSTWDGLAKTKDGQQIGMTKIGKRFRTDQDPRHDKRINTLATGLLAKQNSDILRKYKIPITGENLYLAHNIGAETFARALTGKADEKGLKAMRQNGMKKGETPKQFVDRQRAIFMKHYSKANELTIVQDNSTTFRNAGATPKTAPNIQTITPPTGNPNREQVNQTNSNTKSSQVTIHQEYKTEMTINGAREPQASAQAVKRSQENANVLMARNAVGAIA
ncbi:hypothetical protein [Acinetobacter ursingii]|uniref:hypothetical protein n=1 Tax=Acinetobacter ursingii TaxID=108980 RepID=UPI0021CD2AF0|nr:hypothetical protein [Acinetobacter ursingii]MCU4483563.1 hypothetical protein [Acinetobacter ursingii]MCU4507883.1 hypothetical protein [Acinetobacter ursingii]